MNQIILGDNLSVMKDMQSESIDLCYIDPPFFTQRDWGSFSDIHKSLDHYLEFLELRVREIHRLLKPTGSFYLHLDYHAVHYAKVLCDKIFGYKNFKNDIIWRRKNGGIAKNSKRFPCNNDLILFYTKSNKNTFNAQFLPHNEKHLNREVYNDNIGLHKREGLHKRVDLPGRGSKNPEYYYEYKGYQAPKNGWRMKIEKMIELDNENLLHFPLDKDGRIRVKSYLKDLKGNVLENIWIDFKNINWEDKQRTGYPTQKPELLLERIIKASSNEGDLVFDCFAGSGTTLAVAKRLNRNYIGIDSNPDAIKIIEKRLSL